MRCLLCTTGAHCFNIIYINFMLQRVNRIPVWWTGKLNYGFKMKHFQEIINLKTVSVCKQSFTCVTNRSSTKQQRDTIQASQLGNFMRGEKKNCNLVRFLCQFNLVSLPSPWIPTFKSTIKYQTTYRDSFIVSNTRTTTYHIKLIGRSFSSKQS